MCLRRNKSAAAAAVVVPGAVDDALLQSLKADNILTEPKASALEALGRWNAGETPGHIAAYRIKPIQVNKLSKASNCCGKLQ